MRLIAHRGASAFAPENTLAAFKLALKMRARAVELDVHLTRDGRLAVIHDASLKRTCGSPGLVGGTDYDRIVRLDAGSWFSPDFKNERVPLLSEVLKLLLGRAEINVELKKGARSPKGVETRALDLAAGMGAKKSVVFSSFDHALLFSIRRLDPSARIGYLLGRTPLERAFKEMKELGAESLNLSLRQSSAEVAAMAHGRGFKIMAYTAETRKDVERLERFRVDAAFANDPGLCCS